MRLTTRSEYSLLSLVYLARQKEDTFIKVEDICDKYKISKKYLEQLLTVLKQNRYVVARRGSSGGYKLSKSPKEITVAEIIRLFDGALAPVESVSQYFFSHTPLEKEKKILTVMKDIRDYISEKLENLTLEDIV